MFKSVEDVLRLEKPIHKIRKTSFTYVVKMEEDFECQTMEGLVTGKSGDYLAVGVMGEVYPIAKEVFDLSYEIVNQDVYVVTVGDTKYLTSKV